MIRLNRQILVLPLVACLLLVPALSSPAMVAHEAQHTHHKATMHSSPLCSWLCGAGQGFGLIDSIFGPSIAVIATLDIEPADQHSILSTSFIFLRGPPSTSR